MHGRAIGHAVRMSSFLLWYQIMETPTVVLDFILTGVMVANAGVEIGR